MSFEIENIRKALGDFYSSVVVVKKLLTSINDYNFLLFKL